MRTLEGKVEMLTCKDVLEQIHKREWKAMTIEKVELNRCLLYIHTCVALLTACLPLSGCVGRKMVTRQEDAAVI